MDTSKWGNCGVIARALSQSDLGPQAGVNGRFRRFSADLAARNALGKLLSVDVPMGHVKPLRQVLKDDSRVLKIGASC